MSLTTIRTRLSIAACVPLLIAAVAACGSDDESPRPAGTADDGAGRAPTADDPGGSGDSRFGLGLERTAEVIVETLQEASGYRVDGTTVTITMASGSKDFDGSIDCLSVGGLVSGDETLVLAYPDGSTTC